MLDRLGKRLQILTGGARDLPARHQTLRSTIDWSYDLLTPAEQALFARLGVFVGGATLDAVEAVCWTRTTRTRAGPSDEAIDGLGSLLDKSLVRRRDAASGEPRFAMLQTIREYAVERLRADGGLDESRERHASYFAGLAEEAEPQLVSADQTLWIERLDDELGNLRAVLQWSLESGRLEVGLRVVGALPRYWSVRGLTDPPRWLAPALERDADVSASVRAKAQFAHGYAALDHGDFARAEESFEASMTMYRELDEPRGTAACLAQLAFLRLTRGDAEGAVGLAERASSSRISSTISTSSRWRSARSPRTRRVAGTTSTRERCTSRASSCGASSATAATSPTRC